MAKSTHFEPTREKDAEIIVKRNFGFGSAFNNGSFGLYEGIAIFANRKGYRYLSGFFLWLAERPIDKINGDPGDHVHLNLQSKRSDEIDFTFDTLTSSNRTEVLQNAGASKSSRRQGTPIAQFIGIFTDIIQTYESYLKNDEEFRESTIADIDMLISTLQEKRSQLEQMK